MDQCIAKYVIHVYTMDTVLYSTRQSNLPVSQSNSLCNTYFVNVRIHLYIYLFNESLFNQCKYSLYRNITAVLPNRLFIVYSLLVCVTTYILSRELLHGCQHKYICIIM